MNPAHLIEPDYNRLQTRKNVRLLLAAFKRFCVTKSHRSLHGCLCRYVAQLEELCHKGYKAKRRRETFAKCFEFYRGSICASRASLDLLFLGEEGESASEECDVDLDLQAVILALQLMRYRQQGIKRMQLF